MEDQLGALGLVLNCMTLWNTFYMNTALGQLRAHGYPVRDEDLAASRPSPQARQRPGPLLLRPPRFPGGHRPLRDPDAADDDAD